MSGTSGGRKPEFISLSGHGTKIEGISSPEGTIQVSYELKAYRRELQVAGSDLVKTDTVYLSARDRGTFQLFSTTW